MGFLFLAIVIFFAVIAISNQISQTGRGRPHFKLGTDGIARLVEYR
jgi:hypothetical protein